jgi:hypothetical protein
MRRRALALGLVLMALGVVVGGAAAVSDVSRWASSTGYAFADDAESYAYTTGMHRVTLWAHLQKQHFGFGQIYKFLNPKQREEES